MESKGNGLSEVLRKLRSMECHNLYASPDVGGSPDEEDEMGGGCSSKGRN
jgi:hypothetical protein